jgi:hypothetical protein
MSRIKLNKTGDDLEARQGKLAEANQSWIAKLKDIATALTALSAAAGIAASSITYVTTQLSKNDEAQRAQLSTFSTYGQYLEKYQGTIQPALNSLMNDSARFELDQAMRKGDESVCMKIINQGKTKTGFQAFVSPGLKDARVVHNYYESVGYGLAQGQLDFEIIFDLITLPAFWNIYYPSSDWYKKKRDISKAFDISQTYLSPDFSVLLPWRRCLASNYYGASQPLSDLSDQVDRLGFNYLFTRAKNLYRKSCKYGKPLERTEFIDPDGQSARSQRDISEACIALRARIREMALTDGKPKAWMKLYSKNTFDIDQHITLFGRHFWAPWSRQ